MNKYEERFNRRCNMNNLQNSSLNIKIEKNNNFKDKFVGVIINSYNRYEKLINIIDKILYENNKIEINVVDDGSTDERYLNLNNIYPTLNIIKNEYNYGKQEYWKTINKLFAVCKKKQYDYIIQIDDDFILCDKFIEKIIGEIEGINFSCFHYQYSGDEIDRWGYGDNWVDGGILFTLDFLKKIDFKIKPINKLRWKVDKNISSGVWHQLSKQINTNNLKVLKTKKSYVIHDGNEDSKMNEQIRIKHPIISKNFIDDYE